MANPPRVWPALRLAVIVAFAAAAAQSQTRFAESEPPVPVPRARDFHKDLLFNFSTLSSRDNLVPLLVGAGGAALSRTADHSVRGYFDAPDRWHGFDGVGRRAGEFRVLGPAVAATFITGRIGGEEKFQRFSYALAQGFVVNTAVTAGIKSTSMRYRPDDSNAYSFPSGHTSGAFMWATVASEHYGWKAAIPAYAFASYVGASRMQSRKHHLSDVIAGATIGYIVGRTVSKNANGANRRVRWNLVVPPGGGAAVTVGIKAR